MVRTVVTIAAARQMPKRMREVRRPKYNPASAGGRKRSRHSGDKPWRWNRERQNAHGSSENMALIHVVRREMVPTAKPPVADHAASRLMLQTNTVNPGGRFRPVAGSTAWAIDTEKPINKKLAGTTSPKTATHGLQSRHIDNWRRITRPATDNNAWLPVSPASAKSPSTVSRSPGLSPRDRE